MRNLAEFQLRA